MKQHIIGFLYMLANRLECGEIGPLTALAALVILPFVIVQALLDLAVALIDRRA